MELKTTWMTNTSKLCELVPLADDLDCIFLSSLLVRAASADGEATLSQDTVPQVQLVTHIERRVLQDGAINQNMLYYVQIRILIEWHYNCYLQRNDEVANRTVMKDISIFNNTYYTLNVKVHLYTKTKQICR